MEGHEDEFKDGGYIHYFDYGDGFVDVYVYTHKKNSIKLHFKTISGIECQWNFN